MSKYLAKRTEGPNGKIYASAKEAKRAWELDALQKAGIVGALQEQVSYELLPAKKPDFPRAMRYVADFTYLDKSTNPPRMVTEDVKGYRTKEYLIKRRLMAQLLGITITEV